MTILALLPSQNAGASSASTPSLIVLPPDNQTGTATLDWLSIGIQDSMTVDLWGMSGVRARAITEYGNLMRFNLARMQSLDTEAAVRLAQDAGVGLVWRGEYGLAGKDAITLTYWVLDAKTGAQLHKQELTGPLSDVASLASRMTLSLLAPSGIPATKPETDRIAKPKTTQSKAFEQNSHCYDKQLQKIAGGRRMSFDKRGWIDSCQKTATLDADYAEAYVNLGWALHSDGSPEAAITAFTTAVTLKPYLLDGWMGVGYVQRDRGNNGMALDAFQKAVAINGHLEWPREEMKKVISVFTPAAGTAAAEQHSALPPSAQPLESALSDEEKQLLSIMEHESLDVRLSAIKSFVRSKGITSIPLLKQLINRKDQAFEVLKMMVDVSVAESSMYLIEALEKRIQPDTSNLSGLTDQNILGVIQLINRRKIHQATPVLIRTLADKSYTIRTSAALTLGDFGKVDAVEPLRKLAATDLNQTTRMSALVALVKLEDAESRETLKNIISEGRDMNSINYAIKLMKQRNIRINNN